MKKNIVALLAFFVIMLLGSCTSGKNFVYFENIDSWNLATSQGLYDAKIMPKDELTITVATTDPAASAPFNLAIGSTIGAGGKVNQYGASSNGGIQNYLVDNQGNIDFPVIGKLHVSGLTKNQCQDMIKQKISPYLAATERPIVTVKMSSFRVTVIGEVNHPGVISVPHEKMSIVEALAQAGDITMYGKRDNVLLIRENEFGEKTSHRLNMNDAGIITSPYFYLQQNDIICVEPTKVKLRNANYNQSTSIWVSLMGTIASAGALVFAIIRLK